MGIYNLSGHSNGQHTINRVACGVLLSHVSPPQGAFPRHRKHPEDSTIRNVSRWMRPGVQSFSYYGMTFVRRWGRRMRSWAAIGLRIFGAIAMLWTGTVRANPIGEQDHRLPIERKAEA